MLATKEQFKAILVDTGLVKPEDLESSAAEAAKTGSTIEEVLVERNLVPEEYLGQLLAEAISFPYIRLENQKIPDHLLRIIPERVARKVGALVFGKDDLGRLLVAMRDPSDLDFIRLLEKKSGVRVLPHFATARGLQSGLERYASDLNSSIEAILEEAAPKRGQGDESGESGVIRVVELLMAYAFRTNASDVHIEPREGSIVVRYRIDGILHDVVSLPQRLMEAVVTRIKILSKMRTDEHFAAQDGKFQELANGERLDVRVSVLPVVDGEKVVMRLLSEKGKRFGLKDLGFSDADLKKLERHIKKSFGMVLAVGPTGSGKTTTMYTILRILNTRDVNIATIEDPIEYSIEGVNQIQVNAKTGLTFSAGLRSIVRQDPDIIMVGEIRDEETAGIAVNSAMTGHLVLSTLHTNDAATTLPRFRDMKVEPFLIASTVNVIVAQRLVRKICGRCITSQDLSLAEFLERFPKAVVERMFGKQKKDQTIRVYHGKGCDRCGDTGYQGRVGIYEILEMEENIRDLIMTNANAKTIRDAAVKNGMTTMLEDGIRKALEGVTTIDEALRVAGE